MDQSVTKSKETESKVAKALSCLEAAVSGVEELTNTLSNRLSAALESKVESPKGDEAKETAPSCSLVCGIDLIHGRVRNVRDQIEEILERLQL